MGYSTSSDGQNSNPLHVALALLKAGISVVPVRVDGTKAAAMPWTELQTRRLTEEEAMAAWAKPAGIAIIGGDVSGGLEIIDFDEQADVIFPQWQALVEAEAPGLLDRCSIARTPRPGYHIRFRSSSVEGNQELAKREDGKGKPYVETRGTGGYALAEGSPPKSHPSGRIYEFHSGTPLTELTAITDDEREILIRCACFFDRRPPPEPKRGNMEGFDARDHADSVRPGDAFIAKHTPADLLAEHGWKQVREVAGKTLWLRPGKEEGWSASTGLTSKNGRALARIFTESADVAVGTYDAFSLYAAFSHNGDLKAAAAELGRQGYGEQRRQSESGAPSPGAQSKPSGSAEQENIEALNMPSPKPWPVLDSAARYGLPGDIVAALEPHSEADPVAILVQLLAAFGSVCGRGPCFQVESDFHHTNIFVCLVGQSSKGRKGTSRGRVQGLMKMADPEWVARCVVSGLSSGEGLIWQVRDPISVREPVKEKGRVVDYQWVETDPGVEDKRLLVEEGEFAKVLRVMQREGNSLSPIVRQCWDSGNLRSLTKNSPAQATGAHISLCGHITSEELSALMSHTDAFNGFANRFLWTCVRRSRLLPDGGCFVDLQPFGNRLASSLTFTKHVSEMRRDGGAVDLWHAVYPHLTAERYGLYGAVTGRAESQVLRLSMLYALLDESCIIDANHLNAALALWKYADDSAHWIFGNAALDPLGEHIIDLLKNHPQGLTRTELHRALSNNAKAAKILASLAKLRDQSRVHAVKKKSGGPGAPSERWFYGPAPDEKNESNE